MWGLAALLTPRSATAQQGLESYCDAPEVVLLEGREGCLATAQAITSAQPLLGILIAGGNPTLGTAGAPGLRLGILPRVSAGLRLNLVAIRLPDILAEQLPQGTRTLGRRLGVPAPALAGEVSIGLFDGLQIAPGLGGIGGLSLLGSAAVLPFEIFDTDGFNRSDLAWGIGGRLHLLDESFIAPGVALSVMRLTLPEVGFGDICPAGLTTVPVGGEGGAQISGCATEGDAGEFIFDLSTWSTRLVASKRFLGIGASLGVGHDSHASDLAFGFRGGAPIPGTDIAPAFRVNNEELDASRWTVFGDLSFTLLIASISAEAGWIQGDAPLSSFRDLESSFDPDAGAWYGSIGARLSL